MPLPRLLLVRQRFPDRSVRNIPAEVAAQLSAAEFASRLRPGSRVAIGVGSRGIANLALIVRAVVDFWKGAGMQPFVFPAMGSHGAATAEGQERVLAQYGVHDAAIGCPVVSSLDVVSLGCTPEGIETFMDRSARESDGVMLVNRVKWHTDFSGKLESGLFKMMAIGLGKFAGARKYHTWGYRMGLEQVIRCVGRQILRCGNILGGLAILEDANHNTAMLQAVPVETMETREEELLELVKSWMGRITAPHLDLLIVDEIGKNISGTGMDTKVINRSINGEYNPWPDTPRIERIFARDLNRLSYGNGVGIGMADVVHERLVAKIDWPATQVNSLTASTPAGSRTPIHFPTDRECVERIAQTAGRFELEDLEIGWIRNTMELNKVVLSENLRSQIASDPALEILAPPFEFAFDAAGDLISPLAPAKEPVPSE